MFVYLIELFNMPNLLYFRNIMNKKLKQKKTINLINHIETSQDKSSTTKTNTQKKIQQKMPRTSNSHNHDVRHDKGYKSEKASRDARKIKKNGKGGKINIDGSHHKKGGYLLEIV